MAWLSMADQVTSSALRHSHKHFIACDSFSVTLEAVKVPVPISALLSGFKSVRASNQRVEILQNGPSERLYPMFFYGRKLSDRSAVTTFFSCLACL